MIVDEYNILQYVIGMHDINSIVELVDALGGDTKVARWLGISQPGVALWKIRNHIPPGWHMRLWAELTRRGYSVNPEVFGLSESDLAPLAGILPAMAAAQTRA